MYMIQMAGCQFVAGAKRALVMDLQRGRFQPVPVHMKELVETYNGKQLCDIYMEFDPGQHSALDEYFCFLLKEEYIFLSEDAADADRFIPLPLTAAHYSHVDNAIIDIDAQSDFNVVQLIHQLTALGCEQIQVRAYSPLPVPGLLALAAAVTETVCRCIEFIVPYDAHFKTAAWNQLFAGHQRIGSITCYGAPENGTDHYVEGLIPIYFIEQMISGEDHCGVFHPHYFTSNAPHFMESRRHNTCLNRKIAVDKAGYIRNCPSMPQHYGHVSDTTLQEALNNPAFTQHWHIHKDMVQTCRDCEFRHVCTDCRAYLEDPHDGCSKPLKCGYDPYTATWSGWADNPLKQAAIGFYEIEIPCSA